MNSRRYIWGALLVLLWVGCDRPNFSTPVDAYTSIVKALRKSDFKTVYGALTIKSQNALSERARSAAKASGQTLTDDAVAWFFARGGRTEPVEKVELVGQAGDEATVRIRTDKGVEEWKLRREAGDWKLDLTSHLEGQPES